MEEKELSDEDLHLLSKQLGRQLSGGDGAVSSKTSCERLLNTPLACFLTAKAREVSSCDVIVRVVADFLKESSGAAGGGAFRAG